MPRNGDGASDNGPIEGKEILHGVDGDETLQHTKHVAPMPEVEAGDALPGMSAGGAAAPIAPDAEQYGVNEPHHDSTSKKRDEPQDASPSRERSHLDKKFTKLDKDEVDMASAGSAKEERSARAQRRQDAVGESKGKGDEEVKKFGGHADVEELHGAATLEGSKARESAGKVGGKNEGKDEKGGVGGEKSKESGSEGKNDGGKKDVKGEANEAEKIQRKNAEKFGVNLGDDE